MVIIRRTRRLYRIAIFIGSWTTCSLAFMLIYLSLSISHGHAQNFLTPRGRTSCTGNSYCTVEPSTDEIDFILFGDLGGLPVYPYVSYAQTKVAQSIAQLSEQEKVKFVINVGDNFYFNGVQDVFDSRFEDSFENVYSDSDLLIPWFTLAGNHDHLGNVSAQIDYTNYSSRWTYPDLYYKVAYHFGLNQETSIDFLMIDTIVLCGNTVDIQGGGIMDWLFAKHKTPDTPDDQDAANKQWAWIENQLATSTANYLFVVGHYPIYSISEHGPIKCLIDRLDPLLRKYNVSAYFSGHDHNLQHIQLNQTDNGIFSTMNYIVSGAGSRSDRSIKHIDEVPSDALLFRYPTGWNPFSVIGFSNGAFIHIEVKKDKANFVFYSGSLEEKYRMSILPRHN